MEKTLLLGLLVALLQVYIVISQSSSGTLKHNFQNRPTLESTRCKREGLGRPENLLKNNGRVNKLVNSLPQAAKRLLQAIQRNEDFDLKKLNEDEVKGILKQLAKLNEAARAQFFDVAKSWSTMTSDERKAIFKYPRLLVLLKPDVMCKLQEMADAASLSEYCDELADDSVPTNDLLESLDRCSYCIDVLMKKRADLKKAWSSSRSKCDAIMEKVKMAKKDEWDVDFLKICPVVTRPEDLRRIPENKFCEAAQLEKLADEELGKKLPRKVLGLIAERLIKCKGELSTWSKEDIEKYLRYIVRLPLAQLKPLTVTNTLDVVETLLEEDDAEESIYLQLAAKRIAAAWKTTIQSRSTAVKNRLLCVLLSSSASVKMIDNELTIDELQEFIKVAKDNCGDLKIRQAAVEKIIERITSQAGFTWTQEKLDMIKSFGKYLSPRVIDKIPDKLFCDNWGALKDDDTSRKLLPMIVRKCLEQFGAPASFTCETLKTMGPAVVFLPPTVLSDVPDAVIGQCIKELDDDISDYCMKNRARCRAIMGKVANYAKANNIKISTILSELEPELAGSIGSLEDVNIEDMGGVEAIDEDKKYPPKLARKLLKLIKEKIGPFDASNEKFTGAVKKLRPLLIAAGDDRTFRNMPEEGDIIEELGEIAEDIDEMSSSNIEALIDKVLQLFDAKGKSKKSVCVDKALIESVAPILLFASPDVLLSFDKKTLNAIMNAISNRKEVLRRLNPKKIKFLTELALENEELAEKAEITDEDVERIGTFALCGIDKDQVNKMSDKALMRSFRDLLSCPNLDEEAMAALIEKLKPLTENFAEEYLSQMGAAIRFVLDDLTEEEKQARKEAFVSQLREFAEKIKERIEKIKESDVRDVSDEEKKKRLNAFYEAVRKLINMAIEVRTANEEKTRVKRQTGGSLDCALLSDVEAAVEAVDVNQIQSMSTESVTQCLSQLSQTQWDTNQCSAWRTHLTSADGLGAATSSWKVNDIFSLGTLVDCLSSSEVQALNIDENTLSVLGQTPLQKASDVIAAFLSTSNADISTFTDISITNMGYMFCGLSPDQIKQLPEPALVTSAKDLFTLSCPSQDQLSAVGNVLVSQIGSDWSQEDPFLVQELGVWTSGLPTDVLKTFGAEHVKKISEQAIKAMSPQKFSDAFDGDDLSQFTREQTDAFSQEQTNQLPKSLQDIVNSNSDYKIDFTAITGDDGKTDKGDGNSSNLVTSLPLAILGLVAMLLQLF